MLSPLTITLVNTPTGTTNVYIKFDKAVASPANITSPWLITRYGATVGPTNVLPSTSDTIRLTVAGTWSSGDPVVITYAPPPYTIRGTDGSLLLPFVMNHTAA